MALDTDIILEKLLLFLLLFLVNVTQYSLIRYWLLVHAAIKQIHYFLSRK